MKLHDFSTEGKAFYHQIMRAPADNKLIYEHMLEIVNLAVLIWQSNVLSLRQLWKLPEYEFVKKQQELTDFVEWTINYTGSYKTVHGMALKQRCPNPATIREVILSLSAIS